MPFSFNFSCRRKFSRMKRTSMCWLSESRRPPTVSLLIDDGFEDVGSNRREHPSLLSTIHTDQSIFNVGCSLIDNLFAQRYCLLATIVIRAVRAVCHQDQHGAQYYKAYRPLHSIAY